MVIELPRDSSKGNLFSIGGSIEIPEEGITIPFWGGFVNDWNGNKNFFVGSMVDNEGLSKIMGLYLENMGMKFDKIYQGRKDKIEFDFEFDKKKRIYLGGYKNKSGGKGKAHCEVHPILQPMRFGEKQSLSEIIQFKQIHPRMY